MATALLLLAYAILLDAAVETFMVRSPIRWWIVLPILGYFAVSALIWRARPTLWQRIDRRTLAIASALFLLALVAWTTWLPGGLSDGVRAVRQPTSTVLSAVTTAA